MKLLSHPGTLLIDHLRDVAKHCLQLVQNRSWGWPARYAEVIPGLAFICGAFHDLGKGTSFFQYYLTHPQHQTNGPKHHALISALFVKEFSACYLQQSSLNDFEKGLLAHFAFTAVKRHHGKLRNFDEEMAIGEKLADLTLQVNNFYEEEIHPIIDLFATQLNVNYRWDKFKNYILSGKHKNDMLDFYMDEFTLGSYDKQAQDLKISCFYLHQLLFSCLLLSDKTQVILKNEQMARPFLDEQAVDQYRRQQGFLHPKTFIDQKKNQAFEQALQNLDKVFAPDRHLYSMSLPTGLGKTISSFAVALKLKKLLNKQSSRIIIAIPFTSVIDQNFEVFSKILATDDSSLLLKHHHLAEPLYKTAEDQLEADQSQFLIETWQSEVVVSTFVQLIDSVFSNDKARLMKLPNLANSIIVLDEVQNIPYEYWQLIRRVFYILGEVFHCYFIFMSATQPLIFTPGKEITEIIPAYKSYFSLFNRTRLINRATQALSFDEFTRQLADYLIAHPEKDVLVIINTKKHCLQCFQALIQLPEMAGRSCYYLSTLITPYERKKIIQRIKSKASGKPMLIVSTQLVEAGVDISVDTVFRTMAPLDAIIQAAGRANRYGEKGELAGELYLYQIEELAKANAMLYGQMLMQKTANLLQPYAQVEEKQYLELIEQYFTQIHQQSLVYDKELKWLTNLQFADLGSFSLIEEKKTESVFIQLNEQAREVWERYIQINNDAGLDPFKKQQAFALIKSVFYDFVINVPVPFGEKSILFDSEKIQAFYLSPLSQPSKFYLYSYAYGGEDFFNNQGYKELSTYTL